jgi:hypothetical protein
MIIHYLYFSSRSTWRPEVVEGDQAAIISGIDPGGFPSGVNFFKIFRAAFFCTKVLCATFLYLQFVFESFVLKGNWQKNCS